LRRFALEAFIANDPADDGMATASNRDIAVVERWHSDA
jgi:hypothetical protein